MINRKAIFIVLILAAILLVFLMARRTLIKPQQTTPLPSAAPSQQSDSPKIISTKPDPLEEAVIFATEQIEITFSHPLENEDQFKNRMEPKTDYKIVLSQDKKTAKIIPQKPYNLGTTYTLFILPDSKFEGIGEWREEKIFHFQTIKYRGV